MVVRNFSSGVCSRWSTRGASWPRACCFRSSKSPDAAGADDVLSFAAGSATKESCVCVGAGADDVSSASGLSNVGALGVWVSVVGFASGSSTAWEGVLVAKDEVSCGVFGSVTLLLGIVAVSSWCPKSIVPPLFASANRFHFTVINLQ